MMNKTALVTIGQGYGNIVMATPTIAAVRSLGYWVDVLVESHQPDAATLLAGWDAVDSIYLSRQSLLAVAKTRRYDIVVRTLWNRGAPLQVGPEVSPEPLPPHKTHEAVANLTGARAVGYNGPMPPSHVEGQIPFWPLPQRFIAVAPGYGGSKRTDWARKAWPHWPALCDLCHERFDADVVVLGAEADERGWMKRGSRPWLHSLCGRTSIRGAAGVISRSEHLLAIDNGLAHIGAALNRGVTVLFGPTSEVKNRPLGPRVSVIAPHMDCRPCQMTGRWNRCDDWRCMRELDVEDVLATVECRREESCQLSIAE